MHELPKKYDEKVVRLHLAKIGVKLSMLSKAQSDCSASPSKGRTSRKGGLLRQHGQPILSLQLIATRTPPRSGNLRIEKATPPLLRVGKMTIYCPHVLSARFGSLGDIYPPSSTNAQRCGCAGRTGNNAAVAHEPPGTDSDGALF